MRSSILDPQSAILDLPSSFLILLFFTLFFWPLLFGGRIYVVGDALVYTYPLRAAAWELIRQGQLPLWTPYLLSGYPLLAMSPLGLGYPLGWGYLFLPGYLAEEVYVLAPYLLAPLFVYAYLRECGRSRAASLLAGLSFTYGGMMAGGLSHNGMLPNAVMWLPLMLLALERVRNRRWLPCLLLATFAYAMSVLTGLGQGFLYAGIIALAYAGWLAFEPGGVGLSRLARWRPWLICVSAILLSAGVAAFQILETLWAQRLSIRSELTYEVFSAGSFTAKQFWQTFIAPLYHFNHEMTAYLPLLAALFALAGAVVGVLAPRANWRALFWLGVAVLGGLLMLGDGTPLYRLAYRIPPINLFRVPWRHAFEWTLGASMLAAFGWDALAGRVRMVKNEPRALTGKLVAYIALAALGLVGFLGWQRATVVAFPGWGQPTTLPETSWLLWKTAFTLLALFLIWWAWTRLAGAPQRIIVVTVIAGACFWEQHVLFSHWCFPPLQPASYFEQRAPSTAFLQQVSGAQQRVYTSAGGSFVLDLAKGDPHNLSVRRGLHNAAGYEPMMSRRYNQAFGAGGNFSTPAFSAPFDPQILKPEWQVLDLLNVRWLAEYGGANINQIEKDGARFAAGEAQMDLRPGGVITLAGAPEPVDTLTLVTVLTNSGDLAQDEPVARVTLHTADGRVIERSLRAGVDTAEWAYERPDVKTSIRHKLPRIFDSRTSNGGEPFQAHRYWTRLDFGEPSRIERIELRNLTAKASLVLSKATLYANGKPNVWLLTPRLPAHWRKVFEQDYVQIYENQRVLPRAWLVPQAEIVGATEALRRIRGEGEQPFDPRALALLETAPLTKVALPQGRFSAPPAARIISYEPSRLLLETEADKAAVLVLSEVNFPGWVATVDGAETPIYATNYLLRGLLLPAGKHRVELRYTAPGARRGAVFSLLTLLLLSGLFIKSRWEDSKHDRDAPSSSAPQTGAT